MRWHDLRWKWRDAFRRKQLEADLDDEIKFHVATETQRRIDTGESPVVARRAALGELGSVGSIKECIRDAWGWRSVERWLQDLRFGVRMLGKQPAISALIVLSLSLGIGGSAAAFSAINGLFLKTLPVSNPEQLVRLKWSGQNASANRTSEWGYSAPDPTTGPVHSGFSLRAYEAFRENNVTVEDLLAFAPVGRMTIGIDGQAEVVSALLVSGTYFTVLGVNAEVGRTIAVDDDQAGAIPVAMISNAYWHRRFGGDPRVVGRSSIVNNVALTIVGVTLSHFQGAQRLGMALPDIILPLSLDRQIAGGGRNVDTFWWLQVLGRLRPNVSHAQVQLNFEGAFREIASPSSTGDAVPPPRLLVETGARGIYDTDPESAKSMTVLTLAVSIVLAIVCANVGNLLLSRAFARRREISVRLSLGATRFRLVQQLLAESLLLSTVSSVFGIAIGYWLQQLLPTTLGEPSGLDWRVFGFVAMLTLSIGICVGLAPALTATRIPLAATLSETSRTVGRSRMVLSRLLVVLQVAMSVVLLVSAGLLLRSLGSLRDVDLGFNPNNVLIFRLNPSLNGNDQNRTLAIYAEVEQALKAIPGVTGVTQSRQRLLSDEVSATIVSTATESVRVHVAGVAPTFFETMEIPLLIGRQFTPGDNRATAAKVAIVNEAYARQLVQADNPIRQRFREFEIVGLVKDTRHVSVRESPPPTVYIPYLQAPVSGMTFEVRSSGDPSLLVPQVRNSIGRIDLMLPLIDVMTQSEQIETRFTEERFFARSYSVLGTLAVFLASIGLLGVLSNDAVRRTNEVGIRIALGARSADVIRMFLGESLALVALGMIIGVAGAITANRVISSLLFGIEATDGFTYASAIALVTGLTIVASYVPARRAARIEPMAALRVD